MIILKGINIFNGYITNKEVADAFKLPYSSLNNFKIRDMNTIPSLNLKDFTQK